jgi:hypothetical protein
MLGASVFASSKTFFIRFSASPDHLLRTTEGEIAKKENRTPQVLNASLMAA